jgi:alpha-L-fucosidase
MKRRDMLKAAGTLAATPFLLNRREDIFNSISTSFPAHYEIKRFGDGRDWFFEKRFGMFIHWGLYSIPAWHEQHQWRANVPREDYVKFAEKWNPVKFNPDSWLDLAEKAGMEYITITTKHHDGFCLWDTKQTNFNTMNTPYKQDIIRKLADACHRRNFPLCLYYSIADWNHPNYPNQGRHHELPGPEKGDMPDWDKYMGFLKAQVRELCTNYGEIHGFWWDMNVPQYKDPSINEMIRKLQPKAIINNRGFDDGDFGTPERDYNTGAASAQGFDRPTEACQSVGMESWGYKKDEDYYTDRHLIRSIDSYLSRDSNYLLNAGPTAEGIIPEQAVKILNRIGIWYYSVRESFENTVPSKQYISDRNVMLTTRDKTIYVHFNKDLPGEGFKLKPINIKPLKAVILNTGKPCDSIVGFSPSDHAEKKAYLRLRDLPSNELSNTVVVVKLEFDRPLDQISKGKPDPDIVSEWQK